MLNKGLIRFNECMQKCRQKGFHLSNATGGDALCKNTCRQKYLEYKKKVLQAKE